MTRSLHLARLLWLAAACGSASATLGAQNAAESSAPYAWARITYLSGASAYIEAGTKDGIREGTRLEVIRGGASIAALVAEFVSTTRASCKVDTALTPLAIGDSVRYVPARADPRATNAGTTMVPARRRASSATALRGRIGLRYLVLNPGFGSPLSQPALDLRLDGQHLGNTPFGIAADIRAQRSTPSTASASATGNVTRVYQAALIWNPLNAPTRITAGRQFAAALSSVGLFDGVAIDLDRPRWSIGAFGGLEPDAVTLGLSNLTRKYGAYAQLHSRPSRAPLWSLALGGVGAYSLGQIDREFAFVRATYNDRRLSVYAAQELDINRAWKSAVESASTTPTSSFITALLSLTDALSLSAGMDKRRNVRLYRDYLTPEITFDDSFRQGEWGGAALNLFGHLRVNADARSSSGVSTGQTQSVTGSFSLYRLTPLQVGMHVRATTFTGTLSDGRLQSASLEVNPFGILRIEVSGGTRDSSRPLDATSATHLTWTGSDADISIGRSVYLMLSTYRESGPTYHSAQSFVSLSYRF
jgi:hypothetical protein